MRKRINSSLKENRVLAYSTANSNLGNYRLRQNIIANSTDNVLYDDEVDMIKVRSFQAILEDIVRTTNINSYKSKAQSFIVNLSLEHIVSEIELNKFIHKALQEA